MASRQFACFFLVAALNVILSFVVSSTAGQATFTCPGIGWYPHPTDCTKYYVCDKNLNPTVKSCSSGTHYDPVYQDCETGPCPTTTTSTTPSTTTSTTTPSTTTSTTTESTTTSTTESTTSTTTESTTTSTTPSTTTTTTESTTTSTTPSTTTSTTPSTTTSTTPSTTTSTTPSTTTSTTPSTTTTKTTVTTTSTPTTTEKPCKKPGQTFPDPTSKCNFYRCDVNLNPVKEKCPFLTIYDSSTGGCIFGFC
ncbi:salivary glue protein Sgs-3-like [Periplaneta americana]|uniref:salivary glue protein Sgs-3-like n=1 Tax=Periplaneta americana TaxID=6978 RepID=UPI0037E744D1